MAKDQNKVIAKVPREIRAKVDFYHEKLGMTMGVQVREALERLFPVLDQRLKEKEEAMAAPQ